MLARMTEGFPHQIVNVQVFHRPSEIKMVTPIFHPRSGCCRACSFPLESAPCLPAIQQAYLLCLILFKLSCLQERMIASLRQSKKVAANMKHQLQDSHEKEVSAESHLGGSGAFCLS